MEHAEHACGTDCNSGSGYKCPDYENTIEIREPKSKQHISYHFTIKSYMCRFYSKTGSSISITPVKHVSSQLNCGDTCDIWKSLIESNKTRSTKTAMSLTAKETMLLMPKSTNKSITITTRDETWLMRDAELFNAFHTNAILEVQCHWFTLLRVSERHSTF